MQMGELVHLPDGRIFLCNGAQLGNMQTSLHLQTLRPIKHVQMIDCTAGHLVLKKTAKSGCVLLIRLLVCLK